MPSFRKGGMLAMGIGWVAKALAVALLIRRHLHRAVPHPLAAR